MLLGTPLYIPPQAPSGRSLQVAADRYMTADTPLEQA